MCYRYKAKEMLRTLADLDFFTEINTFAGVSSLLHLTAPHPALAGSGHEYFDYAFTKYAPLSARLIDTVCMNLWHKIESSLNTAVQGGTMEVVFKGHYSRLADQMELILPIC